MRPGIVESGVLKVSVPAPALTKPTLPLAVPLPPLSTLLIARSPSAQMLKGAAAAACVRMPPLIEAEAPVFTSTPPLLLESTWSGLIVTAAPASMVSELIAIVAVTLTGAPVRLMLLLATKVFAAANSVAASGRRIAVVVVAAAAASPVANEMPVPLLLVSINAHGRMPFVAVPVAPVWPSNVKPPVVDAIEALPAPTAVPRFVPRKSTDAPLAPVLWMTATLFAAAV